MKHLDANEMAALCDRRIQREMAADIEGLMATLGSNPVSGHPGGPKIEGRDAMRAHYEGILRQGRFECRRLGSCYDVDRQEAVNEYVVVTHLDGGGRVELPLVQIVAFEDGLMQTERLYHGRVQ
jgi:hypothetical protein